MNSPTRQENKYKSHPYQKPKNPTYTHSLRYAYANAFPFSPASRVSQLIIIIPFPVIVIIRCAARRRLILMLVVGRTVARVASRLSSVWCHIRSIHWIFISKFVSRLGVYIGNMGEPRTRMPMGWMRLSVKSLAWLTVPTLFRCRIRVVSQTIDMMPDRRRVVILWIIKRGTCLSMYSSIIFFS